MVKILYAQLDLIMRSKLLLSLVVVTGLKTGCLDMINNPHHRITINKFRLGNHKLRIETGRHTIPKTPINLRICLFCHSNEVENEIHFLFSCQLYDGLRLNSLMI